MTLPASGRTALFVGIALASVLASHEASSETEYFATQSDWMGVKCSERTDEEGGYLSIQECIFPGANLPQVYNIVKGIEPNLRAKLPAKNIEYDIKDIGLSITYTYKKPKHLYIELFYPGGVTGVEIIEKKNATQATVSYSD